MFQISLVINQIITKYMMIFNFFNKTKEGVVHYQYYRIIDDYAKQVVSPPGPLSCIRSYYTL
jgi:hypothetical protein